MVSMLTLDFKNKKRLTEISIDANLNGKLVETNYPCLTMARIY